MPVKELQDNPVRSESAKIFTWTRLSQFGIALVIMAGLAYWLPIPDFAEVKCFKGHDGPVLSLLFTIYGYGERLLTGGMDGTVRYWSADDGAEISRPEEHSGPVAAIAVSTDYFTLLSASWDKTIRLREPASREALHAGEYLMRDRMGGICIQVKGTQDPILVREPAMRVLHLTGHTDLLKGITFTPDGRHAVSNSWDRTVRLWDLDTGQEIRRYDGHTDKGSKVAVSPDGRRILSASLDGTARVWDLETGRELVRFTKHESGVYGVAISLDGKYAFSSSTDRTIRQWDIETGEEVRVFRGHKDGIPAIALSPDGRRLLSAGLDHSVRLWDVATGKEIRRFRGHRNWVTSVAFSPDGTMAASGSYDGTARLWRLPQ